MAFDDNPSGFDEQPRASPYSEEDAQTLDKAKRVHKETTASAQRALKVITKPNTPPKGNADCLALTNASSSSYPATKQKLCS